MWIPRDVVFDSEHRQMGSSDPQRMDYRSIVYRRLIALQYVMNDQGSVVDNSGNVIVAADDTSGTGQTPGDLAALGYSPDQIAGLAGSTSGNVFASGSPTGTAPNSTPAVGGPGVTSGSSSWLSGLGSLFGSIGTTATNLARASSSTAINPATGVRYGINPATGLPYPAASQQAQSSILLLVAGVVILWMIFKG